MKKIRRDAKRVGHGKMLCPFCKVIQQINHQSDKGEIYLQCKHKRTPGLLPLHSPGSVSAESLTPEDAKVLLRKEGLN
jgi:phage FluMu protein Com